MHKQVPKRDPIYYEEDEISLAEILSTIKKYSKEVLKVKWWIMIFSILTGSAFYLHTAQKELTYTARSTFMLQENVHYYSDNRDPYGVYGDVSRVDEYKVVELGSSKRIINAALKHTKEVNNVNDLLLNHFLNIYSNEELQKSKSTFQDEKHSEIDKKLNYVYNIIAKDKSLLSLKLDETTEIFFLSVKTINEALSIELANAIYEEITSFYVKKSIEKSEFTYNVLTERINSVMLQLNTTQEQFILLKDKNRNLFSTRYEIETIKLEQEIEILRNIYRGLFEKKETVEFNLNNEMPIFQLIDKATSPIRPHKKSTVLAFLAGILFGGFLSIGFIILRKALRDTLKIIAINLKQ